MVLVAWVGSDIIRHHLRPFERWIINRTTIGVDNVVRDSQLNGSEGISTNVNRTWPEEPLIGCNEYENIVRRRVQSIGVDMLVESVADVVLDNETFIEAMTGGTNDASQMKAAKAMLSRLKTMAKKHNLSAEAIQAALETD